MKMTKKILCLLMVALLMLTMVACGGNKEDLKGQVNENDIPDKSTSGETENNESNGTEETPSTDEKEEDAEPAVGSTSGKTYENTSLGLGVNLDSNWSFLSLQEIATQNGVTYNGGDQLISENVIYEAMAVTSDNTANLIVNFEDLGAIYGATLSEEGYIDIVLPQLQTGYESSGFTATGEKSTVTIDGKSFNAVKVKATNSNNISVYQTMILVKTGRYMGIIGVTGTSEAVINSLLANFYTL